MIKDLITIIIPIYNVEKYIRRCLDSIVKQRYERFELLLIDDGSIDDSALLSEQFTTKDRRIVTIHQKNKGVSSARNSGLDIAQGRYLTFVDSDDTVKDNYLEVLYELIMKNNSDISIVSFNTFFPDRIEKWVLPEISCINLAETTIPFHLDFISTVWSRLFKKQIINDNLLHFYENFKNGEDGLFLYQYLNKINKASVSRNLLYNYYINPQSAAHTFNPEWYIGMIAYFEAMFAYLKNLPKIDKKIKIESLHKLSIYILKRLFEYYDKNVSNRQLQKIINYGYIRLRMRDIFSQENVNKDSYNTKIFLLKILYKFFMQKGYPYIFIRIYLLHRRLSR